MKDGLLFSGCDSIAGYLLWHYESMAVDTNPAWPMAFQGQTVLTVGISGNFAGCQWPKI